MYSKEIKIAEKLLKKNGEDGIRLLINLIVRIHQDPHGLESEKEKTAVLFGKLLTHKNDRSKLLGILKFGIHQEIPPATIQFLANLAADVGNLKGAACFTEEACSLEAMPLHLINFYLDLLDSSMEREKAIEKALLYLEAHPHLSLGDLTAEKFLRAYQGRNTVPIEGRAAQTDEDLGFLNLIFKIVKLCYCQRKLEIASCICQYMERVVAASPHLLSTSIKNDFSYFQYLAKLLTLKTPPRDVDTCIYIMGDSHCLSPGWDIIESEGKRCLIQPVLVTGCKLWHLRDSSLIHAKVNYQEALRFIPEGSTVIYLFGEIDCREGILQAVNKGLYPSVEAAIDFLLKIYRDRVKDAIQTKKFAHIYIHEVPPVLDVTRSTVMLFNRLLKKSVLEWKKNGLNVSWLGFKDDLLLENSQFNPLFEIDGVHLHPRYFETRQVE